jgi:hypothetical protein
MLPDVVVLDDLLTAPEGLVPLGTALEHPMVTNAAIDNTAQGWPEGKTLCMPAERLSQHMRVLGATGTSKSNLLAWMGLALARSDYPLVVFDASGRLARDLLSLIITHAPERLETTRFIDLSDDESPVAINPLEARAAKEVPAVASDVVSALAPLMGLGTGSAPRALHLAEQALTALCHANLALPQDGPRLNLGHLLPFFAEDPGLRHAILEKCPSSSVHGFFGYDGSFDSQSATRQRETCLPVTSAIDRLMCVVPVFLPARAQRLDASALRGGDVFIVTMGTRPEQAVLASLLLNEILRSREAASQQDEEGHPVGLRLILDEEGALAHPHSRVPELMERGRQWDVGVVYARQMLETLDARVERAMQGNTLNHVVFTCEGRSAELASRSALAGQVSANDIMSLPMGNSYVRFLRHGQGDRSPVIEAGPLPEANITLDAAGKMTRQEIKRRTIEEMGPKGDDGSEGSLKGILEALGPTEPRALSLDERPFRGW